ncbi:MAG TPA: RNA 3'-terminal phosphate cyclase, partial [Planctomycetota bacterium]|nr:RNA 3'-terminal phosphate cyclase [Planctomycetota bacterium]
RIAEREITEALRLLNWTSPMGSTRVAETPGPGNVLLSTLRYENLSEVFIAHGRPGISAEQVALNLVRDMRPYIASSVPVWEHLADQLLLPFALAGAGTFCTRTLSLHSRTNLQVIGKFLDLKIHIEELPDRLVLLTFG